MSDIHDDNPSSVDDAIAKDDLVNIESTNDLAADKELLPKKATFSVRFGDCPELSDTEIDYKRIRNYVWTCKICNHEFRKQSKLDIHFRSHTGEKPYACAFDGCEKAFRRSDHLKRHSLSHTNDRRYTCTESGCTKSFITAAHLKRHMLCHSNLKPTFTCPHCPEIFTKKTSLRCHRLEVHDDAEFKCGHEHCDRVFSVRSKLDRHLQHHLLKRFRCGIEGCGVYLATYYDLKRHLSSYHKKDDNDDSDIDDIIEDDCNTLLSAPSFASMHDVSNAVPISSNTNSVSEKTKALSNDSDSEFSSDTEDESSRATSLPSDMLCRDISSKRSMDNMSVTSEITTVSTSSRRSDGRYYCNRSNCDRSFTAYKNLKAHIKAIHENAGEFVCNYPNCNQLFGFKVCLKRHVQRIHVENKNPRVVVSKYPTLKDSRLLNAITGNVS